METRVAKELLHIQHWLEVAASIVARGKETYDAAEVMQEAGDSLMIKIGEAAKPSRPAGQPAITAHLLKVGDQALLQRSSTR